MQPTTPRDFLVVSRQRLDAAMEINKVLNRTLEAQYISGYSVECSLKALILEKTPEPDRAPAFDQMTRGAMYHRAEVLLGLLRERGVTSPVRLVKKLRRFVWSTNLRYEAGRKDSGETNGMLKTAELVYRWVEGQIT